MITFTIDSIEKICEILKNDSFPSKTKYLFNDGLNLRLVSDFVKKERFFDIHGMSTSAIIGYSLHLSDGAIIDFIVKEDNILLKDSSIVTEKPIDYGIHHSAHKYFF